MNLSYLSTLWLRLAATVLPVLERLSGLLLLQSPSAGAVVLLVLAVQPALLAAGLLAVIGERLVARLAGPQSAVTAGPVNALLSGLLVGHLVGPGTAFVVLAVLAGVAAHLTCLGLGAVLRSHALPVLSLPFAIVGSLLWLVVQAHAGLPPAVDGPPLLLERLGWAPLDGFLRCLSALVFLPHAGVGLALFLLILIRSRILAGLAVIGWATAVALRLILGRDLAPALAAIDGFNPVLTAMAIGGFFLVPSWRSLVAALAASALAALVCDGVVGLWAGAGPPSFTLPFALATQGMLLALAASGLLAVRLGIPPEISLAEHGTFNVRFPGTLRTVMSPVLGTWSVWQGAGGPWTHRGQWRHAIDLVIRDPSGRTHEGDGAKNEDYHAWHQPVVAPVRGLVVVVVDGLPDRRPGSTEAAGNWGNHVVIRDPRGFHVELSHFACGSLRVWPGQWVERGEVLGLCGSSGYSPQPHLHLQVQADERPGGETLPFSLVSWWDGQRMRSNELPVEGDTVEQHHADPWLWQVTALWLGERFIYEIRHGGRYIGDLRCAVVLGDDGGLCLASDRGRLSFGVFEGVFYHYRIEGDDPWLRLLFLALPRLPLAHRPGLAWSDAVPIHATGRTWRTAIAGLLALAAPERAFLRTRHRSPRRGLIDTELLPGWGLPGRSFTVEYDLGKGIKRITGGDLEILRNDEVTRAP